MTPTRRTFLGGAAALGLAPLLGRPLRFQERARPLYVDGLCFLPEDLADLPRTGLDALVLDVSAGERVVKDGRVEYRRTYESCLKSIAAGRKRIRESEEAFLATRGSEIAAARERGKTAVLLQFQGCDFVEDDVGRLDVFHELGLRVLQITHHYDNTVGGGALEPETSGLTDLGRETVARMDELGLIPDLSHASDETSRDVLATSKRPVIVSHGGARALVDNARCTPDAVIRGVAESGGVMGVFMMSFWLTTADVPTVDHLIAQIRHVAQVGGIDAVGIANDYPATGEAHLASLQNDNAEGVKAYHPWWKSMAERGIRGFDELPKHVVIPELNDARRMFTIQAALEADGFSDEEVAKILGGNWIRVLTGTLG